MAMSESEIAARTHNLYVRKRDGRNPWPHHNKHKLGRELLPVSSDPDLTIQLKSSTIRRLKNYSWTLDNKGNEKTYDQLILHLLDDLSPSAVGVVDPI